MKKPFFWVGTNAFEDSQALDSSSRRDVFRPDGETGGNRSFRFPGTVGIDGELPERRGCGEKIRALEHDGDDLVREVYAALHSTFIVPIDHGDISMLAGAIDDVIDVVDHTAATLVAYHFEKPTLAMARLAELLERQSLELQKAISAISNPRTYGQAAACCAEIKRLEDEADAIYTAAIGELFASRDAVEIIKQKDVLACLETATDKVDKAAHIVSDITVKHA
ncbi:MAG: DUF47 family protein [Candidatus Norongarragalinales archaeon]